MLIPLVSVMLASVALIIQSYLESKKRQDDQVESESRRVGSFLVRYGSAIVVVLSIIVLMFDAWKDSTESAHAKELGEIRADMAFSDSLSLLQAEMTRYFYFWLPDEDITRKAQELRSSGKKYYAAWGEMALGNSDRALELITQAYDDPDTRQATYDIGLDHGRFLAFLGRYREAVRLFDGTLRASSAASVRVSDLFSFVPVLIEAGEYRRAYELLYLLDGIHENAIGFATLEHGQVLAKLGHLLTETGRYAEADSVLARSLEIVTSSRASNSPEAMIIKMFQAGLSFERGSLREAIESIGEASVNLADQLGRDHPLTLQALNDQATIYYQLGQYSASESLFVHVVAAKRRVLDDFHPSVLRSIANLVNVYYKLGVASRADSLIRVVATGLSLSSGPRDADYARALNTLGAVVYQQGNLEKAEDYFLESMNIASTLFGTDHPLVADASNNIAAVKARQGLFDEAVQRAELTLEIYSRLRGVDDIKVAQVLTSLIPMYAAGGDASAAEHAKNRALDIYTSGRSGAYSDHPDILQTQFAWFQVAMSTGDMASAEETLQSIFQIHRRLSPAQEAGLALQLGLAYFFAATLASQDDRSAEVRLYCSQVFKLLPEDNNYFQTAIQGQCKNAL